MNKSQAHLCPLASHIPRKFGGHLSWEDRVHVTSTLSALIRLWLACHVEDSTVHAAKCFGDQQSAPLKVFPLWPLRCHETFEKRPSSGSSLWLPSVCDWTAGIMWGDLPHLPLPLCCWSTGQRLMWWCVHHHPLICEARGPGITSNTQLLMACCSKQSGSIDTDTAWRTLKQIHLQPHSTLFSIFTGHAQYSLSKISFNHVTRLQMLSGNSGGYQRDCTKCNRLWISCSFFHWTNLFWFGFCLSFHFCQWSSPKFWDLSERIM